MSVKCCCERNWRMKNGEREKVSNWVLLALCVCLKCLWCTDLGACFSFWLFSPKCRHQFCSKCSLTFWVLPFRPVNQLLSLLFVSLLLSLLPKIEASHTLRAMVPVHQLTIGVPVYRLPFNAVLLYNSCFNV